MKNKAPNILITGGSGFLGGHIVRELLAEDCPLKHDKITVYDIRESARLTNHDHHFIKGDICDYALLERACQNIDIVIHCAAIVDWGTKTRHEVLAVNVEGTRNVIRACLKNNIRHLVYTSSLDAVFTGTPLVDIDENQEYPELHHTVYCESKKLGELAVLNIDPIEISTCILRPSDIYGEADPYHMDALIDMAKSGFYVRLGNGKSKCQHVYVRNMAHAHVLAAQSLWEGNEKVSQQIYFITDGKGTNFFTFFDKIVKGAGYNIFPKNLWLPFSLAYAIGSFSELIARLWRPVKHYNPKFSRFAVLYTCTDFTFSSAKAKRDFNFQPKYSSQEAFENTVAYYADQRERDVISEVRSKK